MERLLVLRLEAHGCDIEAVINGVPVARVGGKQGLAILAIHEYIVQGSNEIEMIVNPAAPGMAPASELRHGEGPASASLKLLLPRVGRPAEPATARMLAQLDWAAASGDLHEAPLSVRQAVELPIAFPRWRWLDAPHINMTANLRSELAAYVLNIAAGLTRGDPDPLLVASRLRLEELAKAYQRNVSEDVMRFKHHLQQLHAAQALKPSLPQAPNMLLRPIAGGRLIECLNNEGGPLLQSPIAGGARAAWPLRIASSEGKFYVLR